MSCTCVHCWYGVSSTALNWLRVPGSHKWLKQIAYAEHDIDPPGAVSPLLKAGDALIFCALARNILCTIADFGRLASVESSEDH